MSATTNFAWRPPPENPAPRDGEAHIWRVPLDEPDSTVRELFETLAPDEKLRAGRFHFARDRRRFTVARGALRAVLGRYLNLSPALVNFVYNPFGKPALAQSPTRGALHFNLSHAHELALCAVTLGREVGVDVEWIRRDLPLEEMAARVFSPRELATLRGLPAGARTEAFFNCWTRKEAYIKAVGKGVSMSLDQFDVTLAPGEPAALTGTRPDPREAARWSLHAFAPAPDYVAAVAVEGPDCQYEYWRWRP